MKLTTRRNQRTGELLIEIMCSDASFTALLRALEGIEGVEVLSARQNPMNDDALASFRYAGKTLRVESVFSDFEIRGDDANAEIEALAASLQALPTRWWHPFV